MKRRHLGIAVAASMAWLLLVAVPPAAAEVRVSTHPYFGGGPVAVGATAQPANLAISNTSSGVDGNRSFTITDIGLVPSCGTRGFGPSCPTDRADSGVFQISSTGAGRMDSACAGMTFDISAPDPDDRVRFTPRGGSVVLGPVNTTSSMCVIDFTFDTVKAPTLDARTETPGTQTAQIGSATVIAALGGLDFTSSSDSITTVSGSVAPFAPLSPARVWDSRFGPGPTGRIGAGVERTVVVTGIGGVPASGVTAVVLNVTAVAASAGTYVTAWPAGEARPLASNLNVPPGDTRPNLVLVEVGAGGAVSFFNDAGTVDLVADVTGWFGPAATQRYAPISPARVWDTRFGPGPTGRLGAGELRDVVVTGLGGVPAGATAVVLNVTAVAPTATTFVTAWPTGETRPLASNLNVPAGDTRPNLVIVKVGGGGKVSFFNDAGTTDLIADVAGYYGASGARLTTLTPTRVFDTRLGQGIAGRIGPGGERNVVVTGVDGFPASSVRAVVLNVTAVGASAGTFITAWPAGEARPLASNLNVPPGDTRANLVVVKVGAGGAVSFSNDAGTVDVLVDVFASYGAPDA